MSRASGSQLRRVVRVGMVVVLSMAAGGCGGDDATPATTTGVPTAPTVPVVIDTDAAIDDLVALTFLLASDDVDVRAITVSGTGEVRCPAGVGVVQELLAHTGDAGVPVACGRATPLDGAHEFARGAVTAPRELAIVAKQTIRDMADVGTHPEAVERELDPQLWTVAQPWFEERIAALQARIESRRDR